MPRSCVGDGRLFLLMTNLHKQGKLAHVEPRVMQADCYLCLREAKLKLTRVALHFIGSNRNRIKRQHSSVYSP